MFDGVWEALFSGLIGGLFLAIAGTAIIMIKMFVKHRLEKNKEDNN